MPDGIIDLLSIIIVGPVWCAQIEWKDHFPLYEVVAHTEEVQDQIILQLLIKIVSLAVLVC